MAANSFAKNTLGWEAQQLQRRFSEWVEFQLLLNVQAGFEANRLELTRLICHSR
ncbi:MAG: hypothetical protein F6K41_25615 [Symploca sp. SIO3E6]|nr:hypothetical protein [Caldora sp. SIO3E6]